MIHRSRESDSSIHGPIGVAVYIFFVLFNGGPATTAVRFTLDEVPAGEYRFGQSDGRPWEGRTKVPHPDNPLYVAAEPKKGSEKE